MAFIELNDTKIRYKVLGNGFPLILIQGMSWGMDYWMDFGVRLSENYKVIMYDNRGSGKSGKPKGSYSIRMMAEDLKLLMSGLNIEKSNIMGISMGGMIAQEFVLNYPYMVSKLIIGCSWCGKTKLDLSERTGINENLDNDNIRNSILNSIKRYASAHLFEDKEIIENLVRIEMENPQPLYAKVKQSRAVFEYHSADRLPWIDTPTLVIVGESDTNIPLIHSKDIYNLIPDAEFQIIKDANHMFWLDNPEKTYQSIRDFLNR